MGRKRKTHSDYIATARIDSDCLIHHTPLLARQVWQMVHGPLTRQQYVCHHCDTPKCILLDHLFIGTCGDNVRDAVAKRRHTCLRKGGTRFSGPHSDSTRQRIAEASRQMWVRRREQARGTGHGL